MTRPITLGWLLCLSALVSGGCLSPARPGLSELVTPIKTGPSPEGRQAELPPHKAAEACLVTAQMLEKHGHEVEAIAEYELARSYNPKLQVSRRLAVLYDRQCDYARAMHEYRQALKQSPKDVELLNDVGYCCYERGDWAEAEKYLRQAVQLNPSYKRAWVNLGLVLGQQERYDESYQAFAQVLTPAEARSNVGVILMQHGKFEEAKAAFREALAQDPDIKQARAFLRLAENPPPALGPPANNAQPDRSRAAADVKTLTATGNP